MRAAIERAERHQVPLYLAALAVGAVVGIFLPAVAASLHAAITPVLGLLMFATFLGVPFASLGRAFSDVRFVVTVLALNFVLLPAVVFGLSRFVAADRAVLLGVLLVLLTPCVDYVIVFTGIAGGARDRLLAVTPLLMVLQLILLPAYLWLMAGPNAVAAVDAGPFVEALLLLIALPLILAAGVQWLARRSAPVGRVGRAVRTGGTAAMVPLMVVTLAVVVASQTPALLAEPGSAARLGAAIPLFLVFALVAAALAAFITRGMDVPGRRAVVFSGVTRNSLVVLPLALALSESLSLAPLVVVSQTLVELIVMVLMVALVPRLIGRTPRG